MNKAKLKYISFVLVLSLLSIIIVGCGSNSSISDNSFTFAQLISQADKYNNKTVTMEACYFGGFEISVLCEAVGPSTYDSSRIVPTGALIWVEKGISEEIFNKLYVQTNTPSGYAEHIGKLKVTGIFITGGHYGHMNAYNYKITITTAELLDWSPPPVTSDIEKTTVTEADMTTATQPDNWDEAKLTAQKIAEDFILNSSTFKFDGIDSSIDLSHDDPGFTSAYRSWSFTFKFETRHPGHGDRTGQFLAEVITPHYATVLVDLETQKITMAACDESWDMLRERDLAVYISGIVISGTDSALPDGPVDVPRVFTYKILKDRGDYVNVSYTSYPPSPTGDAAREKITLDFYNGEVRVGDKMDACGRLDKESNTIIVAEQGDYIKTSFRQATVLGVVINISDITALDSHSDTPHQFLYELLREDGTFVNVRYTAAKGATLSLYIESIKVGDYMKAVGTYLKDGNIVVVTGPDDMIKTYQFRVEAEG
jgi:hypothetical protein